MTNRSPPNPHLHRNWPHVTTRKIFRLCSLLDIWLDHINFWVTINHTNRMPSHVFLMTHMNFGVYPSETREVTVKITVSGSSLCTWNCIFTHADSWSLTHDGGSGVFKQPSFCTRIRKRVVPAHSHWTPGCPAPKGSLFHNFLPPFLAERQEGA